MTSYHNWYTVSLAALIITTTAFLLLKALTRKEEERRGSGFDLPQNLDDHDGRNATALPFEIA